MSIRFKVILPYLFLTIAVAAIAVYVVTRLVAGTLSERLTNQLIEAGRVISDGFVRQERTHVSSARILIYTSGLSNALKEGDAKTALELAQPASGGLGIENVILITPDGRELVHLVMLDGELQPEKRDTGAASSPIVRPFLQSRDATAPPLRAFGSNMLDGKFYYYTALPVPGEDDSFAGVIIVGTSLDTMLPLLKNTSLADVVIYGGSGQVLGTTLGAGLLTNEDFGAFSVTETEFKNIIASPELVTGANFVLNERTYSVARGPLQIGDDRIGVFAVVLPANFVIQSAADSRTNYIILFSSVMLLVVFIGLYITRKMIVSPLFSLVRTSQAVAEGELDKRTNIKSKDEIGTLANTFDVMTSRLQERTRELEKANEVLTQMDKSKGSFIQISAHELRTPLTLIMGYAQMLEDLVKKNPEAASLTRGILDGTERMADVVNSMLDVSRIDNNMLVLKKTPVQLDLVVQKVRRGFEESAKERNIKLSVEGFEALPLVSADPDMMQKALHHLVMNAIKYTPDGGSVHVTGKYVNGAQPPHLEIAVKDTGIGIDPASHEVIFNKFYQTGDVMLHSSGKTKFKGGGPGLGLAIARGIVQAHGGRIWVESPGHDEERFPGSTFFISLPVKHEVKEKENEPGG